jgi:hypothetical protein
VNSIEPKDICSHLSFLGYHRKSLRVNGHQLEMKKERCEMMNGRYPALIPNPFPSGRRESEHRK